MPDGAQAAPEDFASAVRRRLTYVMLFRLGVVSLLLVAALAAELGTPADQPVSSQVRTLIGLIVATYGLTIVFALGLKRTRRRLQAWAAAQVTADLLLTTALVHFTGGADSGFVFMYLLVVVGASFVLGGRGALLTAGGAVLVYAAASLSGWAGFIPRLTGAPAELPLRGLVRVLTVNAVAMAATGALGARLAVEVQRAREHIESQGLQLRDLSALYEDMIRCLTSGLITVTTDGKVITYNAAAAEILGRDAGAALGRPIAEVLPGLGALIDSVASSGGSLRRGEVMHQHPQAGERVLGVSLSPLVDAEGAPLGRIVNFQDVTQLRDMQEAMARSERLAAVGRLAAGIAHEIRNPLAAISGSIELLSEPDSGDGDASSGDHGELMAIVLREVARLNTLITELLEFARPRAPVPQALELGAEVQELLRVAEHDRELDGARIELTAAPPVWVDADAAQLRQVIWNLLRNAAEASPHGEPIVVEIGADGAEWALVTVRDRGPGIPEEHRARIFEPFFSTKERGTGLGLATVHRIVEEHRGSVEIGDPAEGGAAVTVRLPRRAAA